MGLRQTFFQPTAVIRTDTETGERVMEIDFDRSMIKDNDHYLIDPEGSDRDGEWLDQIVTDKAFWEPTTGECLVRIMSLDPVAGHLP